MKNLILVATILLAVSCAKKEETSDNQSAAATVLACTYYFDAGTYAYFKCTDFAGNGYTEAGVKASCDQLNSGTVSAGCPVHFSGSPTMDSTGSCAATTNGDNVTMRWYYSVVGNGPSETALCTAESGTFTAN